MATETGEGATETGESPAEGTVSETDDSGYSQYERQVIVTTGASLLGILAGVAATLVTSGPGDNTGLLLLGAAVVVQNPLYRVVGLDVDDFGIKGNLYIAFMTFVLWFITWGIFLTTGALQ